MSDPILIEDALVPVLRNLGLGKAEVLGVDCPRLNEWQVHLMLPIEAVTSMYLDSSLDLPEVHWNSLEGLRQSVKNSAFVKGLTAGLEKEVTELKEQRSKLQSEIERLRVYRTHYAMEFELHHGKPYGEDDE